MPGPRPARPESQKRLEAVIGTGDDVKRGHKVIIRFVCHWVFLSLIFWIVCQFPCLVPVAGSLPTIKRVHVTHLWCPGGGGPYPQVVPPPGNTWWGEGGGGAERADTGAGDSEDTSRVHR